MKSNQNEKARIVSGFFHVGIRLQDALVEFIARANKRRDLVDFRIGNGF